MSSDDCYIELTAGDDVTFYSYLRIEKDASPAQLTKAYRKRSMELHPDKNPGVPGIQQKFARLGVITGILRDGERRDRYNVGLHFLLPGLLAHGISSSLTHERFS